MTTATNISAPNLSGTQNNAQAYFNNFYSIDFSTGIANDAIIAYFEKYTGNKVSANNLASAVLYTAQAQNVDPMSVMEQFMKLPMGQLNTYLVAFLNQSRAPTSSLGIKGKSTMNPLVSRTILV